MGAERDDEYAARRAELDGQFHTLPPAGSAAYWQAITTDVAAEALPLEVLVRCYRERWTAGARGDTDRIYEAIVGRVQERVGRWAHHIARQAPKSRAETLAGDLEEECYIALWQELRTQDNTFLAENFLHKLTRIEQHTAHQVMETEGLWQRSGVQSPTRVPSAEIERLEPPRRDEESVPIGDRLYDASADDAFERVELENDIEALLDMLASEDRALVYDRYWSDLSTLEVADQLGVTDRTVRNRLARIYAELRRLLGESQEDATG